MPLLARKELEEAFQNESDDESDEDDSKYLNMNEEDGQYSFYSLTFDLLTHCYFPRGCLGRGLCVRRDACQ